ncbi:MAG: Ig-like domain-containing protein, partial [Aeromicrobium sp.]
RTVSARVIAGSRITIDVPLNGIDPDGDAVQLLGVERSPEKGAVLETGDDEFVYEAGAYSSGTDTFTYTVVDGLGARATGTVRVGISPRAEGGRNPVANEDEVRVRPGKTVSVRVLENDSDPDGSALRVDSAQPQQPGVEAEIVEDQIVDITPPAESGSYSILYTISNEFGGTSQNFVQVRVDPDAPLSQPIASDAVLGVRDVLGRETIGVDVLDGVFFADGSSSELGVGVVPGYGEFAEVESDKRIRVTIRDQSQIIPFYVSHPDDDQVRGYGFIRVPGLEEALPQIDPDARALRVLSEDTLTIDLNDHVVALGSSRVRLTDSASVRATHANGDELVVDDDTLRYTSAPQFFGPASITFEVTDGTAADDPDGRTAILTLPIIVEARENQPPSFVGSEVAFEPGQQRELDLLRLTNYPHPEDLAELVYQVLDPAPTGFTYSLNGQRLVVTADADAAIGSDTSIVIGVRDANSAGEAGRVRLSVVPSTRPLAQPSADVAIVERGSTSTIDVLANDEVTNPFPGEPLTVVAVRGLEGGSLPAGVRITPSADNARLTVTVAADAAPTDANLQYRVADATGDPSRYVWGSVQISVQDRPDPVSNVRVTEFGDRQLRLTWGTGAFNNSPITEYRVQMTSAADGGAISTTTCSGAASCTVQTPGNGPANAVRLAVSAVNGIGASDASTTSGSIWSDIIPPSPVALGSTPLDQGLRVTWRKPDESSRASPISYYVVTVGGVSQNVAVSESDPVGTLYSRNIEAGLTNGSETLFTVSARNRAPNSLATWNSASGTGRPAGPPVRTSGISASSPEGGGTTASVSWSGAFDANGRAIEDYYAVAYTGSTPACVVEGVSDGSPRITAPTGASVRRADGSTTSTTLSGLSANTVYSIAVFAYNGQGCTASSAVAITPRVAPGIVTAIDVEAPDPARSGTTYDSRLRGLTVAGGNGDVSTFVYRLVGSGVDGSESPQRSLRGDPVRLVTANGSHYGKDLRVQVKACATYSEGLFCSESWSTAFPLPTAVNTDILSAVSQTFDRNGGAVTAETGTWNWSASFPSGYSAVTATCDRGSTSQPVGQGAGSCAVSIDPPYLPGVTSFPPLTITITANGQDFTRTYPGSPDPNPILTPNE